MGTKMKPKTHKKRNPYWRSLRHFKGKSMPSKKTYNRKKHKEDKWTDNDHKGCPSYPFCYMDPNGCSEQTSDEELEWYGHRD